MEPKQPLRVEIICTGDEVLSGKIVNANFSYIAQKLEDAGCTVARGTTVGDDLPALKQAFRVASTQADVVIVNGGLGPTVDDLSQQAAAEAAGVALCLREDWLQRIQDIFDRRGREMTPNNRKQALLPEGAELLDNPVGTACGFALSIGKACFYFTPGVPSELYRMLDEQILPHLRARVGDQGLVRLKRFHCYGLGESQVDRLLAGVEALAPSERVKLGFRAHYPQIEVKLTLHATDALEAERTLAPLIEEVRRRLGRSIVAEDDASHEGQVFAQLARRGYSLAIAEQYTGGLLAARLTACPEAERWLQWGISSPTLAGLGAMYLPHAQPATLHEDANLCALACAVREAAGAQLAIMLALFPKDDGQGDLARAEVAIALTTAKTQTLQRTILSAQRVWLRAGAVELGLDTLRRWLLDTPKSHT